MVWETEVAVIVMVTRCVELGKRKCAQYWPESDSGTDKHGGYSVTVASVQNCEGYDLRTLKLAFKVNNSDLGEFKSAVCIHNY